MNFLNFLYLSIFLLICILVSIVFTGGNTILITISSVIIVLIVCVTEVSTLKDSKCSNVPSKIYRCYW